MLHPLLEELGSLDTSRRSLRSFGFILGGAATLIAVWIVFRSGSLEWSSDGEIRPVAILGLIGLGVLVVSMVWPRPLLPLFYVWMALALVLGAIMTRVILTTVFVVLIVPIGTVMRLLRRDPLNRQWKAKEDSYWVSRQDMDRSPDRLEKYY